MTSARLDLRHLRLLLALIAITLGLIAAVPHGASAEPNNGTPPHTIEDSKKTCTDAGGTWTIDGTKAFCKGISKDGDYSCNLVIAPNGTACSHLPRTAPVTTVKGSRVETAANHGVSHPEPTTTPKQTRVEASNAGTISEMSPLDE